MKSNRRNSEDSDFLDISTMEELDAGQQLEQNAEEWEDDMAELRQKLEEEKEREENEQFDPIEVQQEKDDGDLGELSVARE